MAMLIDSGCIQKRPFDPASLAKQTHGRVGEAKNPGPARGRDLSYRAYVELDEVLLVEPATVRLGEKIFAAFVSWVEAGTSPECADALLSCPETLGELVHNFGIYMFDSNQSLYMFRQLVTHLQRSQPSLRLHFGRAWQTISRWEICEPAVHRTPLPLGLFRAMISLGLSWGWKRWSSCTALAFYGLCRPGEVLRAFRSDLLLPADLLGEDSSSLFLNIRAPKTRRRGGGRSQHTKVQDSLVTQLCAVVFGALSASQPLYPGSPASFRRRWDAVLDVLLVPSKLRLTPASLRAGGAVREYRQHSDVSGLMWKMRLKSFGTLERYLQEVGADSVYLQLPPPSRAAVRAASALYEATVTALLV